MLKILNDLFEYLSIDYTIINKTLLGQKIFKGINIFEENIEFLIESNNIKTLLKEKDYLLKNEINIEVIDNKFIKLDTVFFNNVEVVSYIYLFNQDNNILTFCDYNNKIYNLNFYDIFPIEKQIMEEFFINVPNKINSVLQECGINIDLIIFKSYYALVKKFFINNPEVCKTIIYVLFVDIYKSELIYF